MQKIRNPWQQIHWKRSAIDLSVQAGRDLLDLLSAGVRPATSSRVTLRAAVSSVGDLSVPGSPLDEARVLLSAASEIEHALLIEYLYLALSMGSSPLAGNLRSVAIQEMCHLMTVQNLLLFVGGVPHFERTDQSPDPGLDPFSFTLRPLRKEFLEDYLLAEMPPLDQMSNAQREVMQPIVDRHSGQLDHVNRVGVIYARLFWLFQADDQPAEPWKQVAGLGFPAGRHIDVFPGQPTADTLQADPDAELAWSADGDRDGIFLKIDSRQTALQALAAIAAQGEGLLTDPDAASHFTILLDINKTADFSHLPAIPLPIDPFIAAAPAPEPSRENNRITHPLAAALCALFDLRYRILLASLRAALTLDRSSGSQATRTQFASWALAEMKVSVRGLARNIVRFPCKAGGAATDLAAAPTFSLTGFELPDDQELLQQLLRDLHGDSATAKAAVRQLNPDAGIAQLLQTLDTLDQARFPAN